MRILLNFFRIIFLIAGCAGVHQPQVNIIRLKGSDTMLPLTTRWAEAYMKQHPNTSIYVAGGGSALGFKSLIKGDCDICASSRPIQSHEAQLLAQKYGKIGMAFLVAKDALSIYLHPENPVQNLALDQVKAIFTGAISQWSEVGGNREPIHVVVRSPNSGTYLYFMEHVLEGQPYVSGAQITPTTTAMVKIISEKVNAIGYGGIAYGQNLKHCHIDNVAPTPENVRFDLYPFARYLYLYTIDTPQGEVKRFIDWVLKDGQAIVRQVGYIPIWEVQSN
ncbi:MAG: phosphate ABC transporter substrate-binding protein [candidate division KSB1 bacterium]|nr:phosphate ABC transporter substrate-binding protein [candidate division KSB1 bacterium]